MFNSEQESRLIKALHLAINEDLTEAQKRCIVETYFKGNTQKEVADKLNIHPSVVSRTNKSALAKLKLVLKYVGRW